MAGFVYLYQKYLEASIRIEDYRFSEYLEN
jgi:hypothetical protein